MKLQPLTTEEALLRARHITDNPHQMVNENTARRVIAGLLVALDCGGVLVCPLAETPFRDS